MESLISLRPSSLNEFSTDTPSHTPPAQETLDSSDVLRTSKYQFQASKTEIPHLASHVDNTTQGPIPENRILLSKEYTNILQNVYKEETYSGNINQALKHLIISVHAVFLESGFVCFDSVSKKRIDGFRIPVHWWSNSTVSLQYTVPCLLVCADAGGVETVGLKFQTMGKFLYIHGFLSKSAPMGFIRLDASRFVSSIDSICMPNFILTGVTNEADGSSNSFHEREVYDLWKTAKDGLALPLLTDLCVKTGLELPLCFTSLLTDLKLKILEFLPGLDLARVGCVSSELRHLSSNNDLWKHKCMEEFTMSDSGELSDGHWKDRYVKSRENTRRKKKVRQIRRGLGQIRVCGAAFWRPAYKGEDRDQQPQISGCSQVITAPAQHF